VRGPTRLIAAVDREIRRLTQALAFDSGSATARRDLAVCEPIRASLPSAVALSTSRDPAATRLAEKPIRKASTSNRSRLSLFRGAGPGKMKAFRRGPAVGGVHEEAGSPVERPR
jgi:hypothetical protein